MYNNKVVISIGHNAAASYVVNDVVQIAYEEERLSKVKADSSFPKLALAEIFKRYPEAKHASKVVIVTWFWDSLHIPKYENEAFIKANFKKAKLEYSGGSLTHHDLHASSVWHFTGNRLGVTIVADGFGNDREVLSVYSEGDLVNRNKDICKSLGLMFQFATEAMDLKPFKDEYKLLGYEQEFIKEVGIPKAKALQEALHIMPNPYTSSYISDSYNINETLKRLKKEWLSFFAAIKKRLNKNAVAFAAQYLLETYMLDILKANIGGYDLVQLSGGVFYNVKLNNRIIKAFPNKVFSINPVAGDQGNVLQGNYENLFLSVRSDTVCPLDVQATKAVILKDGFCSVRIGNMEFGPRALGNTSTLAIPTAENVAKINKLNKRDTVMPMAPIVTQEFADKHMPTLSNLPLSKFYMTTAVDFQLEGLQLEHVKGALHTDILTGEFTCRAMIATKPAMVELLNKFDGILLNTSYNAHGQPILFSAADEAEYKLITE